MKQGTPNNQTLRGQWPRLCMMKRTVSLTLLFLPVRLLLRAQVMKYTDKLDDYDLLDL